jgi:hypothetical protein
MALIVGSAVRPVVCWRAVDEVDGDDVLLVYAQYEGTAAEIEDNLALPISPASACKTQISDRRESLKASAGTEADNPG